MLCGVNMLGAVMCRLVFRGSFETRKLKLRWREYSKLSYIHKLGKEPLRAVTGGNLLEDAATKYRDMPFMISRHQKKTVTFGELLEEADRLAAALINLGLRKGDRVGLCLPNRIEWVMVMYACIRADLIMVAMNPAYQAPELEYCINKVEMSALICSDKFKTQNYYEILNSICPEINGSEPGKIQSKNLPSLRHAIFLSTDSFKGAYNYDEVVCLSNQQSIKDIKNSQHFIQPESPSIIQFTSGTTGRPKAAIATHFNMVNNGYQIAKRLELDRKHHVVCNPLPLFHAAGITVNLVAALHFGTTLVFPTEGYNPDRTLDAIVEEKCTLLHSLPTMFADVIEAQLKRNENIDLLETVVSGGQLLTPTLYKKIKKVLKVKKIKLVYGLTESTVVVFHTVPDDDDHVSMTTVGLLGDHLEAKVIDPEGRTVPFGQPGELCIRGYSNMLGYWKDEEKTKEILGVDGWLKTGDQFILEENGYGKIVGRLKDMIIRGGENIFPKEIEEFLITHPDISDVYIVGTPHERFGEEVCAFVKLKEGKTLNREDLVAFCKGKLAHFKVPSRIEIVNSFPRTASGKVQKYKLKELISTSRN